MPVIRHKSELGRRALARRAESVSFLKELAPELKGARGELVTIQPGGELEWRHPAGAEAFFLLTRGAVKVDLGDRQEVLEERSLLWLEPGDRVVLQNLGAEAVELFYLEASG